MSDSDMDLGTSGMVAVLALLIVSLLASAASIAYLMMVVWGAVASTFTVGHSITISYVQALVFSAAIQTLSVMYFIRDTNND